ncbi:hypothetical protein LCGC14_0959370 [marine sediment metagenome]|uniref:Uncharacterized protein n=1 Tax=marine sediment metagenome TaxID=412755 RepID=A0A0F9RLC8_9ZZZZ
MRDKTDNDTFNEHSTRRKLLADCVTRFGPESGKQLQLMFVKWDKLIANCKNESEVKHMRHLACAEIYNALGFSGGITMGEDIVIPAENKDSKIINSA